MRTRSFARVTAAALDILADFYDQLTVLFPSR